jgi:hypothetical protein
MNSLIMIAMYLACFASGLAVAVHYALDVMACLKVIRNKQSFVRETEVDEWLLLVAFSVGAPVLLSAGFYHLNSSLTSASWRFAVAFMMLWYVVVAGRRRWLSVPRLCLYGNTGEIVRDHIRRGMALEIAALQAGEGEASRKSDGMKPAFPGIEFTDSGVGVTLVRGQGDWRGRSALKGVLLKRVIQTNMLCNQQLKLDISSIRSTMITSMASVLAMLALSIWLLSDVPSLP